MTAFDYSPAPAEVENDVSSRAYVGSDLKKAEADYAHLDEMCSTVAKEMYDQRRQAMEEIVRLAGVGHTFQDDNGVVYQTVDKKGTFVDFTPYEIKRTQRHYAEKGSQILARKTAEEMGFEAFQPSKPSAEEAE